MKREIYHRDFFMFRVIDSLGDNVFLLQTNQKHTYMIKTNTTNHTLFFSKKIGKLWMLDDVTPFHKSFQSYFFNASIKEIVKQYPPFAYIKKIA